MKTLFSGWNSMRGGFYCIMICSCLINQTGCGIEITAPMNVTGLGVASAVAVTIHELAEAERATLNVELKRLERQGIRDGQLLTTHRYLNDDEVRQVLSSGKVVVNGVAAPVSFSR